MFESLHPVVEIEQLFDVIELVENGSMPDFRNLLGGDKLGFRVTLQGLDPALNRIEFAIDNFKP